MPVNGMMTLADVVDSYSKGVDQRRADQEYARMEAQRKVADGAQQAFAQTIDAALQDHIAKGGDPRQFKPNDTIMFKAAEARGKAFAQAGDWENFTKNEAALAGQRLRLRGQALQEFEGSTKDRVAWLNLVKRWNDATPNGRDVEDVEVLEGGKSPRLDGVAAPTKLRIKFKTEDGKTETQIVDPEGEKGLLTRMRMSMMSPEKQAEQDWMLARQVALEKTKAAETRATKEQEAAARKEERDAQRETQITLEGMRQDRQDKRDSARNDTTLKAAGIRASGGGGGSGGGGKSVQSVRTGADGYDYIIFRDGTRERIGEVKSGNMAKRVDAVANRIQSAHNASLEGIQNPMSMEAARSEAKRLLEVEDAPAAGESGKPAKDYSKLWK